MTENMSFGTNTFKCKQCGGELELISKTHGRCTWCHSKQTVPFFGDSQLEYALKEQYERAESNRREGDFSGAKSILEEILKQGYDDAEIHWLLALCKYGITYVEDPDSQKQVPTFCMMQKMSFTADYDYNKAVELSDSEGREIYKEQAQVISDMQSKIVELQAKEDKTDVFICCDKNDSRGSQIAQKLTQALNKEGIKVFYEDEDPYSARYKRTEPYVFNALMSARVMLLVATNANSIDAPRAKNEWHRFLYRQRVSERLCLIPVLEGLPPYSMPRELHHLSRTAWNMNQPNALDKILKEVQKNIDIDRSDSNVQQSFQEITKATQVMQQIVNQQATVQQSAQRAAEREEEARQREHHQQQENRIRLAFQNVTDQKNDLAKSLCSQVMQEDPENPHAHFCLFMMDCGLRGDSEESCLNIQRRLMEDPKCSTKLPKMLLAACEHNEHFQRALRFGDDAYKAMLNGFLKDVASYARKNAIKVSSLANSAEDHFLAAELLTPFENEPKMAALKQKHLNNANSLGGKKRLETLRKEASKADTFDACMDLAKQLEDVELPAAKSLAKDLQKRACQIGYNEAGKKAANAIADQEYLDAAGIYELLAAYAYKDSKSRMIKMRKTALDHRLKAAENISKLNPTVEGYRRAAEIIDELNLPEGEKYSKQYRDLAIRAAKKKSGIIDRNKGTRITVGIIFTILPLLLIAVWVFLVFNHSLDEIIRQQLSITPAETDQYVRIGLFMLAVGFVFGTVTRYCHKKGLMLLLFLIALLYFPINCLLNHVSPFYDINNLQESETGSEMIEVIRSTGIEAEENDVNVLPLFPLILPAFFAACYIASRKYSVLPTIGTLICLLALVALVDQLNYGDLKTIIIEGHNEGDLIKQYTYIPLLSAGGALVFSLLCFLFKNSRKVNFLFLVTVYSVLISWPGLLEWKIPFIVESSEPRELFLGIALIPTLLVFTIRHKKKS